MDDDVEKLIRESLTQQASLGNAVAEIVNGGYQLDSIDGSYLNYTFRVISKDQSKSCIAKVYLSFAKGLGKDAGLEYQRSNRESEAIGYFNSLVPSCCPSLLAHDEEKHIVFLENLQHYSSWKGCLLQACDLKAGAKVADILVSIHSSSHHIRVGDGAFQELAKRFSPLPLLSKFLCDTHFIKPFSWDHKDSTSNVSKDIGEAHLDESVRYRLKEVKDDAAVQKALTLAKEWMSDTSDGCCIHGDLHVDSVMCDGEGVKLIDVECSHIGPPAFDVALLVSNYVLLYHYHQQKATTDNDDDGDRQHHGYIKLQILDLICITLSRYMEGMGRILGDSFDHHFVWKQVLLFMGLEIIAWIAGPPSFPELNSFPKAQLNSLNTAMRILQRQSLSLDSQGLSQLIIHN